MKSVFILLFGLGLSAIANASTLPLFLPIGFEYTTVDSAGVVKDSENSMKFQNKFEPELSANYKSSDFYADVDGRPFVSQESTLLPSSVYNRSVESIKNANGVVQSVVFSETGTYDRPGQKNTRPGITEFVRMGKDSKVLSHTQCWNGADCFTITSGLCKSLPDYAGVKNLAELYDKVGACQKLSQTFDHAIEQQEPVYRDQHMSNLKDLQNSQTVSKQTGMLKQLQEKWDGMSKETVRNRSLKSVVDGHEMRTYELVRACMFYQNQTAFDESNKDLATPVRPSFIGQGTQ